MLVVIGTDCLGRYKSYYYKITTPNAPVSYSDIEFESSTFHYYHNYIVRNIFHHDGLLDIVRIWFHLRWNQEDILKMR
jgi:hypothetical protein